MNNNTGINRELFHYFKQYIIDRIIENCNLTHYTNTVNDIHIHNNHHLPNTIVASISKSNPDYWYEWVRDSAIVVSMLIDLVEMDCANDIRSIDIMNIIKDYVKNHKHLQDISTINKHIKNNECDFYVTLGEPKYNIDLTVYTKSWGRPQNDGPALRAISMVKLAKYLINRKSRQDIKDRDIMYVKQHLYDSKWPNTNTLIKRDLEYVAKEWSNRSFDLWEEINGFHFYTLMVQQKSLQMGAELADILDDLDAGNFYRDTAIKINSFIRDNFYRNGRILSSIGIINHNFTERYIDLSILLAFIHTNTPHNEELMNTMADTVQEFSEKYTINHNKSFYLMGRYLDDTYYGGNPWVLTTAALSNILMTIDLKKLDQSKLTDKFFNIFGLKNKNFKKIGMKIVKDLIDIEEQNEDTGLSFAEQIDKHTLIYKSANKLTWNYIELVRVLFHIYR
jgi:glucoamylase